MLFVWCIALHFLVLTSHAVRKRPGAGPPCYGRSDCAQAFADTDAPAGGEKEPEHQGPKRYLKDDRFKSPVFGSYKFDPLMGEFEKPNKTDTNIATQEPTKQTENTAAPTVMRAVDFADDTTATTRASGRRNELNYVDNQMY